MKRVGIVGAGPAGLAGAKTLLDTGEFDVTVFEKSNRIGGIWALDEDSVDGYLSPETPTNLSRFTVGFTDLNWNSVDMQRHDASSKLRGDAKNATTPMFPKAWQVNRYLELYKRKYIPNGVILLDHQVVSAELSESSEPSSHKWKVVTRSHDGHEETHGFDFLILAAGFFSQPRRLEQSIPNHRNDVAFDIPVIHSSRFRTLKDLFPENRPLGGNIILVIGGANSSGEVAAAVASQLSDSLYSPETGREQIYKNTKIIHVVSKPLYAMPPYHPYNEKSTAFVPLDLSFYDLSKRMDGPITGSGGQASKQLKTLIHSAIQGKLGGDQSDLGSEALAIPSAEPRAAVYVALSEAYPEFVRSGLIEAVSGRVVSLTKASDGAVTARVSHGDKSFDINDIGAVIHANGYTPSAAVEFLSDDVKQALHYDPSSFRLPLILGNWQTTCPEIPELSMLGFYEGPFWPMIEMQARLTADRWLNSQANISQKPFEEVQTLLKLRKAMQERNLDVPQYWFGDYLGYIEEVASRLKLERNDGRFGERQGCASPARYLSPSSNRAEADGIMQDLYDVWHSCLKGRYVARAAFRAMHGNWLVSRTIDSALASFPSGTFEGQASFHPRAPTPDKSGKTFDLEYIYIETGMLTLANSGAIMPAKRRYVYRYSEADDEMSVWFVKTDNDLEVDYLFHNLIFVSPEEASAAGACIARADHLCVKDMYDTEYRLALKGIALHEFVTKHMVKGPSKDYVMNTQYRRPDLSARLQT